MPRERELAPPSAALLPPLRSDPHPGILRAALHGLYDALWMLAAALGSPWLLWRSLRQPGFGAMVLERAGLRPPPPKTDARRTVLIHGVSVGEVKGAVPLVEAMERRFGELEIVVSATTNTGIEVARETFPGRRVVRFPADLTPLVRRFLRRVRPDFVVLIELEVWPNFLRECNRAGIPVAVVNGRITDRAHGRYLVFRRLLPQFNRLSLICVQDEGYAERFRRLEVDPRRVLVTGNMKADRLRVGPVDPGEELRRLLGPDPGQLVFVAGSTHHPEEELVFEAWRRGAPQTRLILVPRHPERAPELVRSLEAKGVRVQRLTELRGGAQPDPAAPCLADTIGELERVYALADLVFVGGSLVPHGGQNMLEPAAQGKPVVFGPHVENFAAEVLLLVAQGACLKVDDETVLADALAELAADPELRRRMAELGEGVVRRQKGATARTLAALAEVGVAGAGGDGEAG